MLYCIVGATRSLEFDDGKGTTVSLSCESGDLLAVEGALAATIAFNVGTLPMDLHNPPTGIKAVTFVVRLQWSHDHVCSGARDDSDSSFANLSPFPVCIPAWTQFGVLGAEVEARTSAIDGAGFGLFLLKDYERGGPVTEYDGSLRSHAKIVGKRDPIILGQRSSHWRSLPGCDFVIEGISQHQGMFNGRGGASLANHKAGNHANCKFEIVWKERELIPRFCEDDGCFHIVPRIVLTLLGPAKQGDELFVDYGIDTAKRFMEDAPRSASRKRLHSKVGESQIEERQFFDQSYRQDVVTVPEAVAPLVVQQLGDHPSVCDASETVVRF